MSGWSEVAAAYAFGRASGNLGVRAANHMRRKFSSHDNRVVSLSSYREIESLLNRKESSLFTAIEHMQNVMTYINGIRIVNNYKPIEYKDIEKVVNQSDFLRELLADVKAKSEVSDYGRFTQQKAYWREINNNSFTPYYNEACLNGPEKKEEIRNKFYRQLFYLEGEVGELELRRDYERISDAREDLNVELYHTKERLALALELIEKYQDKFGAI